MTWAALKEWFLGWESATHTADALLALVVIGVLLMYVVVFARSAWQWLRTRRRSKRRSVD